MSIDYQVFPKFECNSIPVFFTTDSDYIPYLSVALQSIVDNSSSEYNYDIIVLEDGVTEYDKNLLSYQINGRDNFSIRFFDMKNILIDYNVSSWWRSKGFSSAVYYRLFSTIFFRRFEKVIYLDSDVIVLSDISKLYETDLDDCLLGAVRDSNLAKFAPVDAVNYLNDVLNIKDINNYFNSGVLLLNIPKMITDSVQGKFIEVAKINHQYWHDQNVLNSVCQGKVKFLDSKWNFLALPYVKDIPYVKEITSFFPLKYKDEGIIQEPAILHFAGSDKPWRVPKKEFAEYFWHYAKKTPFFERIICENAESSQLKRRLNEVEIDIETLRENLMKTETRAEEAERALLAVYSSHSWRVTKPVRILFYILREVKKRIKGVMRRFLQMLVSLVLRRPYLRRGAERCLHFAPPQLRQYLKRVIGQRQLPRKKKENWQMSSHARFIYNDIMRTRKKVCENVLKEKK